MNENSISKNAPGSAASSRRRIRERGEGGLKAIVITAILSMIVYTGFKVAPAYMNDFQLHDKIQQEARFAAGTNKPEDQLRDSIYKEMQELGIPAKKEDIKIEYNGRDVKISLDYVVPIDMFYYHGEIHFSTSSEGKSLT
ncbi:MAG: DUF4845 domain-containing protein [Acidobacteriia bacterium]|nr:DUF4845 domain-containing protein [Terriglobia bacterium]